MVPDDKRTQIGPTGPARPATGPGPGSAVVAAVDPLLGQTLVGRYLIQKKLGEGGMGAVYQATHNLLEKQVALKVLHGELARKPDLVERFMQEAKAASRIRHENVIDISDFGTTPEGLVFFAMELLTGHDLHEEITRARLASQLLPWERSKRIFLQICAALAAAHGLGIIHRDLKPENIYLVEFLGEPDFVKLLDFGIAKQTEVAEGDRKLTRTGMLFGTPEYMSPEQARGEVIDPRVDVYAMGCILFQLVTGRVPFEADNFMGVLSLHLTEPPAVIPPEVFDSIGAPRALAAVIDKALAKDRNQRFSSIDELVRAVRLTSGDKATGPAIAQPSVPAPASTTALGRAKPEWTGNLSIPETDFTAAPPRARSKLPAMLGAIALIAGAAGIAGYVASRARGDTAHSARASGSQVATVATPTPVPETPPVAAIAVPPAPAEPALAFEWAEIRLDSVPSGADVTDLTSGKVIGRTPLPFKVRPSHAARQFELHRKDYVDTVIELIPDREKVDRTETLERGAGRRIPPVRPTAPPPAKPEVATPTTPPPVAPELPAAKPAVPVTAPDDDCGDPPCLKKDPSRPGSP